MLLPLPVQNNIAGIASHRAWHRVTFNSDNTHVPTYEEIKNIENEKATRIYK